MKMNDEVREMIQNPRRWSTVTALSNMMDSIVADDKEMHTEDGLKVVCLESIAINLAELTDKVCELTAYMQGLMEWAREQKETK